MIRTVKSKRNKITAFLRLYKVLYHEGEPAWIAMSLALNLTKDYDSWPCGTVDWFWSEIQKDEEELKAGE